MGTPLDLLQQIGQQEALQASHSLGPGSSCRLQAQGGSRENLVTPAATAVVLPGATQPRAAPDTSEHDTQDVEAGAQHAPVSSTALPEAQHVSTVTHQSPQPPAALAHTQRAHAAQLQAHAASPAACSTPQAAADLTSATGTSPALGQRVPPSGAACAAQPDDVVSDAAFRYVAMFCGRAHPAMGPQDAVALAAAIPHDARLGLVGEVHARCRAGLELLHVAARTPSTDMAYVALAGGEEMLRHTERCEAALALTPLVTSTPAQRGGPPHMAGQQDGQHQGAMPVGGVARVSRALWAMRQVDAGQAQGLSAQAESDAAHLAHALQLVTSTPRLAAASQRAVWAIHQQGLHVHEQWFLQGGELDLGVQLHVRPQVLAAVIAQEYERECGTGQRPWDTTHVMLRAYLGLQ